MKGVELYGRVRYAVQIEGLSRREAARRFGIDPRTVARMIKFSAPPGYVRKKPPQRILTPGRPNPPIVRIGILRRNAYAAGRRR